MREVALRGVDQLSKYVDFDPEASTWSLELENDPLGPGPEDGTSTVIDEANPPDLGKDGVPDPSDSSR